MAQVKRRMLKRTWSLQRADIELVILKLRELYSNESWSSPLFPMIKVGRIQIKGPPIHERFLRYLEPIPNGKRFLALDASLKVLFDLGFCKLVIAKVSTGIWYSGRRIYSPEPRVRVAVVKNKSEAGEWLLGIELEEVGRCLNRLRSGDYCLLDRGLIIHPRISNPLKQVLKRLFEKSIDLGIILVGVLKKSNVKLSNGLNALSFIARIGNRKFPEMSWYYHPLLERKPDLIFGSSAVVKFDGEADVIFRADLVGGDFEVDRVLGEVSYLQDCSLPGYPYPLRAVHEEAKISEYELEHFKGVVLDLLEEEGLLDYIMDDLNTTSFKERYLWGW